jgi:hypothetical protein
MHKHALLLRQQPALRMRKNPEQSVAPPKTSVVVLGIRRPPKWESHTRAGVPGDIDSYRKRLVNSVVEEGL